MASEDGPVDIERLREALPAYDIDGVIGQGGFGIVVGGRQRRLSRRVAIKSLPAAMSDDPQRQARFLDESRLVAGLNHPHIVGIYDFVEHDGLYLLVMEHLAGGTLWDRFGGPGLMADESCAAVLATCAALHEAHNRGVVHRDVKPDNVMFDADGVIKLTDFGVSKILGQLSQGRPGEVVGTPAYMAPEQARGEIPGPAADVYSVGVMLYELLAGQLPFPHAHTPDDLMHQHVHEPPLPLRRAAPHLPSELDPVMARTLAKDPDQRYRSAEAVGVALAEAATAAYGTGWVRHGDIEVMAAPRITQALEQRRDAPLRVPISNASADFAAVAPESRSLQRRDPAADTATGAGGPGPAPATIATVAAPPPPRPSPAPEPDSAGPDAPEPGVGQPDVVPETSTGPSVMAEPDAGPESGLAAGATAAPEERAGRGLPRGAVIGLAAAVILAGVLAVVLLTSGGTDDPDSTGAATSGTSRSGELVDVDGRVVPLATAEDFLDACATSGGTPGKCTCVLEGLAARVTVDELERGDLDPTVQTEVEQACTAGGR